MIQVSNLTKQYAAFTALNGINFKVEPGEVVGFLGPNGAGKTTTLRILSGFMPATQGEVCVAGYNVVRESREVRKRTGYLPEDVPLYRDITVEGYLSHIGVLKEIPSRSLRGEIDRVMDLVGLSSMRKKLVGKCSKGFRQRTGLAQALLGDPQVLLLDEPTSGLDPNQVVEVRNLIRELSGQKTVLLSSHILTEVSQICSRVLIIHEGNLVAAGNPEDLAGVRLSLWTEDPVSTEELEQLPGVQGVHITSPCHYELRVEDPIDAAPKVASHVVGRGVALIELKVQREGLEAVFRELTTGDQGHA